MKTGKVKLDGKYGYYYDLYVMRYVYETSYIFKSTLRRRHLADFAFSPSVSGFLSSVVAHIFKVVTLFRTRQYW